MLKKNYFIIFIVFCLITGLSGCAKQVHRVKRDGPPKQLPKNFDKIPNAVPKVEPLSRYGNRFKKNTTSVYKEKNRCYKVMSTSKGYKKQGSASWYGTLFHGKRTSSGEPYNMFAMTAAHPTLPIPTYVKVTNLKNKKSVIVKVNDRGPFRCNRLIDLSYVAAAKLGILGQGTGQVEVQSVDPRDHGSRQSKCLLAENAVIIPPVPKRSATREPLPRPTIESVVIPTKITQANLKPIIPKPTAPLIPTTLSKAKQPLPKQMYLQMGHFPQKAKALALVQKIERIAKVPTSITENKQGTASQFLVQIGPLKNHMEAIKLTQRLAQEKIPCPGIITQR